MLIEGMLTEAQRGFSLVEIMVAVMVLAVGLLGVAGLQSVAMQHSRNAPLRAQALQLGEDMLDRIRANPAGDYGGVSLTDAPPAAPKNCADSPCDVDEMAQYDIAQWKCGINPTAPDNTTYPGCEGEQPGASASLPNGAGAIARQGGMHRVQIQWQAGATPASMASITLAVRVN